MKSKTLWLSFIAVVILACAVCWTAFAQKQTSSLKTWEYKAVNQGSPYPDEKELNALGAQGWELVSVVETNGQYYLFKRAK